jgi:hypothetical protein
MASLGRRVVSSVVVVGGLVLAGAGGVSEARAQTSCDPAYTSHCVPPVWEVGDLNCQYFYDRGIYGIVLADPYNDPHGLDEVYDVGDGYGCEGNNEGTATELSGTTLLGPDGTYRVGGTSPSYGEPVYEESVPLAADCDPSYPDLCIPPAPPYLNCDYVYGLGKSHITVYAPDPHGFDGNGDGIGCEG